jgi:hypothetical protein
MRVRSLMMFLRQVSEGGLSYRDEERDAQQPKERRDVRKVFGGSSPHREHKTITTITRTTPALYSVSMMTAARMAA